MDKEHTANYKKATPNLYHNSLYKATKLFKCSNTQPTRRKNNPPSLTED